MLCSICNRSGHLAVLCPEHPKRKSAKARRAAQRSRSIAVISQPPPPPDKKRWIASPWEPACWCVMLDDGRAEGSGTDGVLCVGVMGTSSGPLTFTSQSSAEVVAGVLNVAAEVERAERDQKEEVQ